MKVGIVTIVDNNFGNRLQNYALQEYLKKLSNNIFVYTFKRNYSKNVFLGMCKRKLYNVFYCHGPRKVRIQCPIEKEVSQA